MSISAGRRRFRSPKLLNRLLKFIVYHSKINRIFRFGSSSNLKAWSLGYFGKGSPLFKICVSSETPKSTKKRIYNKLTFDVRGRATPSIWILTKLATFKCVANTINPAKCQVDSWRGFNFITGRRLHVPTGKRGCLWLHCMSVIFGRIYEFCR